jgi:hypothetical protein
MKIILENLANAIRYEHLAATVERDDLKSLLLKQAKTYRELAELRAEKLGIPPPDRDAALEANRG